MNIQVHIERLVIEADHIDLAEARNLEFALRTHLASLLGDANMRPALESGSIPAVTAPSIALTGRETSFDLGMLAADRVHQVLARL